MKKIIFSLIIVSATAVQAAPVRIASFHIHHPQAAVADAVRLAEFLGSPVPPELLYGQLGNLVLVDAMNGIDPAQPFEVFVGERDNEEVVVCRFGVLGDATNYLAAVARRLPVRQDAGEGIYRFAMTEEADSDETYVVKVEGTTVVAGERLEDVEALAVPHSAAATQALGAMPGGVSLVLDPAPLRERLAREVEGMRRLVDSAGPEAAAMVDLYEDMSAMVFNNLSALALNLEFRNDITLRLHGQPVGGSKFEQLITAMAPPTGKIASYGDDRAIVTAYGTMAGFDDLIGPYADWISKLYRQMGPPMDQFADSYRDMILSMKGVYSGGYNMFLLPPAGPDALIQLAGIYEVADVAQAREAIDQMMKFQAGQFSAASEAPARMGATKLDVTAYDGVEIESHEVAYEIEPELAEEMSGPLAGLLEKMIYHVAFVGNHMMYAVGDIAQVHRMIDHVKSAGELPPRAPRGFADVTAAPVGSWELDLGRLASSVVELFGPLGLEGVSAGLRGLTLKEAGGLTTMIRLTRDDLRSMQAMTAPLMAPEQSEPEPSIDQEFMIDEDMEWDEEE